MRSKARPSRRWVRWAPLVVVAYVIGFGLTMVWLGRGRSKPVVVVSESVSGSDRTVSGEEKAIEDRPGSVPSSIALTSTDIPAAGVEKHSTQPEAVDAMSYQGAMRFTQLPTAIQPHITVARVSGMSPMGVHVQAADTTLTGGAIESGLPIDPYSDLEFTWDFGDPDGVEFVEDPRTHEIVNLNTGQYGPAASYVYRKPGTYTVTLTATARKADGTSLSASTTSLQINAVQQVYIPLTTTGTYTLSYGGQTTPAMAYNADHPTVTAALAALSTIGAGNIRLADATHYPAFMRSFEFCGTMGGVPVSRLTVDTSGLSGTTPTATAWEWFAGSTASAITVTAPSAVAYLDPTAGSNGTGTQASPFNNWSAAATWANSDADRSILLKCGTTTTYGAPGLNRHAHVGFYGVGPRPILQAAPGWAALMGLNPAHESAEANKWYRESVTYDGIEFVNNYSAVMASATCLSSSVPGANPQYPIQGVKHWWFVDCGFNRRLELTTNGACMTDFGWYRCRTSTPWTGSDYILQHVQFASFLGGIWPAHKDKGSEQYDHAIYPKIGRYLHISLCDFQPAQCQYSAVNGNTLNTAGVCHHWYQGRNFYRRGSTGVDIGDSTDVNEAIDNWVLEDCWFLGDAALLPISKLFDGKFAIYTDSGLRVTIRNSRFWGLQQQITTAPLILPQRLAFYGNLVYRKNDLRCYDAIPLYNLPPLSNTPDKIYLADNIIEDHSPDKVFLRFSSSGPYTSTILRNQLYASQAGGYVGTVGDSSKQTVAQLQSSIGLDASNVQLDSSPFTDPINGRFLPTDTPLPVFDTTPPSPPTNLVVGTRTTHSVAISWTAGSDETELAGHVIRVTRVSPADPLVLFWVVPGVNSAVITGIKTLDNLNIYVYSRDRTGNLCTSPATATATTLGPDEPSYVAPAVTESHGAFQVDSTVTPTTAIGVWEPFSQSPTSYEIELNGAAPVVRSVPNVTFTGLAPDTVYVAVIRAINALGAVSKPQAWEFRTARATADTNPPTQPGALSYPMLRSTTVGVAWGASTDAEAETWPGSDGTDGVVRYEVSLNGDPVTSVTGRTVGLPGLTANRTYTLSVVAKDAAGNTSAARTGTFTTLESDGGGDTAPPTQPGTLAFSAITATTASVTWDESTDDVGVIEYALTLNGSPIGSTATNSASLTGLTPAMLQTLSIVARDAAGNTSPARSGTFTTETVPVLPTKTYYRIGNLILEAV